MTAKEAKAMAEQARAANERDRLYRVMESVEEDISSAIRGGDERTCSWISDYAIEFVLAKLTEDGYKVSDTGRRVSHELMYEISWGEDV
jgi:hypothetical protein